MRTIFVFLLGCVAVMAQAQTQPTQKIGYAEWEYIYSQLPESKQIETELRTHNSQLENQLKAKYQEYETKLKMYQDMPATTPDAIRKDKEAELTQLQGSIQKFQQDAQTSMTKKQADLLDPVYKKVSKAIEEVAKENSYTFIIAPQVVGGGDILLYNDDKYNISLLVLKKLGITPAAPTSIATPPGKTN
jgi:outer membrane protein